MFTLFTRLDPSGDREPHRVTAKPPLFTSPSMMLHLGVPRTGKTAETGMNVGFTYDTHDGHQSITYTESGPERKVTTL